MTTPFDDWIQQQQRQAAAHVGFVEISKSYTPGTYLERELAAAAAAAALRAAEMQTISAALAAGAALAAKISNAGQDAPITEEERAALASSLHRAGAQLAESAGAAYVDDINRLRASFDPIRSATVYLHAVTAAAHFQALSDEIRVNALTPGAPLARAMVLYDRLWYAEKAAKEIHQTAINSHRRELERRAKRDKRRAAATRRRSSG